MKQCDYWTAPITLKKHGIKPDFIFWVKRRVKKYYNKLFWKLNLYVENTLIVKIDPNITYKHHNLYWKQIEKIMLFVSRKPIKRVFGTFQTSNTLWSLKKPTSLLPTVRLPLNRMDVSFLIISQRNNPSNLSWNLWYCQQQPVS